jgi:large conductance mechanosensitive channel
MSVVKEFRDFIARGNVVDLAVGVIIGAAFGKIVTSLVEQVVMPPIGLLLGEVDFSDLKLILKPADLAAKTDEVAILYGAFINTVIQFVIVALAVFLMVKLVNKLRRNEAAEPDAAPAAPTPTELLLTEIRDALKSRAAVAKPAPAVRAAIVKKTPAKKPASKK